jgi:hypothetical protein
MAAPGCPHDSEIWAMTVRDKSCLYVYNINEKVQENRTNWLEQSVCKKTSYQEKILQY